MERDKAAYFELIDNYAQIIADLPQFLDSKTLTIGGMSFSKETSKFKKNIYF